jgi:hypothetical protein
MGLYLEKVPVLVKSNNLVNPTIEVLKFSFLYFGILL